MQEIERKFLVTSNNFKEEAYESQSISQGFLNSNKSRTVRVRIYGNSGFLTVKGESSSDGTSRFEWEKEIYVEEAQSLLKLCEPGIIEKTRFLVKKDQHVFEIDEFHGENEGLFVAEIELNSADEKFPKPNWLGEEVTGDPKYYNSVLSKSPYKTWLK
ncbi:MAG: CYTH domain-containing protein [Psychroflexus sp.]